MLINEFIEHQDPYLSAVAYFLSAWVYDREGKMINKILHSGYGLSALREADTTDMFLEVAFRMNIGSTLDDLKHHELALEYYKSALPYAEKYKMTKVAGLYHNMGNTYREMKNAEKTIECYNKAVNIYKRENSLQNELMIYERIGRSFMEGGDYPRALQYFNMVISRESEISKKKFIGQPIIIKAILFSNLSS